MKNVFFEPRVGANYESKGFNGIKLLILGESHYCGDRCEDCGDLNNIRCKKFTDNQFKKFFNNKKGIGEFNGWMKTYTRFSNILHDKHLNVDELEDFWNSVIFYNYVQSSAEEMGVSPSKEQFDNSLDAFIEVLEEFKPDFIIVWGVRLWNVITLFGRKSEESILDNGNGPFYYFKTGGKEIPAYSIYHPSSRYFTYEYSKYLKEAIRLVSLTK